MVRKRGLVQGSAPRREEAALQHFGSGVIATDRYTSGMAPLWEIRLAWIMRALILATGTFHLLQSEVLYGLLCFSALALILAPSLVAHSTRLTIPVEIELFVLWWLVTDMTLGRFLDLYGTLPFYDKAIHFGNSGLLAIISFLAIYALKMTCRIRTGFVLNLTGIFLLTLGAGALWEIVEFGIDAVLNSGMQGSPVLAPLEDTMWDLIVDGMGGLFGGLLGALYMRGSRRSLSRWKCFAARVGSA
ncbi:MAG: hypothetical protein CMH13_24945 [Martelella sp.]|uniref:hypothetical protein n=1 Tax=Martelella sp. TaxID=1969699 RepID=UPI000C65673F|nr:hypothetical protein [Martelella sp.]MAU23755.1 hypothetical protein [Martelella sp.]|tara:strand:+ start:1112 stop:1846 length:735 start_codon:yes stop_codon:yes gene_type:complete